MRQLIPSGAWRPDHAQPCRVTGQVRNAAGMPLGGAQVTLYPQNVTVVTSPDGAFSLLLPPGLIELVATSDGREPQSLGPINRVPGATGQGDLVLPRPDRQQQDRVAGPQWDGWVTGHRASVK